MTTDENERPAGSAGALAVVLARAGSKGVPGKNTAPVGGRPCIAWTIGAALGARTVSRVVVSTDGEEIARIARGWGAGVVERPAGLSGDTATVDAAARHAVEVVERGGGGCGVGGDGGWKGNVARAPIVILYANVPVRPAGLIDRAVRMLAETGADSVQSYAPVGKHHPWWTARVDAASGEVRPWEGELLNGGVYRRQDLPPAYIPDGGVIAVTRAALFCEIAGVEAGPHAFFGRARRGIVTDEGEVVDIDTRTDLLVADAVLRERQRGDATEMPQ